MKKILFLLLLGILLFGLGATALAQGIENIQFPIAELGNCKDLPACIAFCENSANENVCSTFAQKLGLTLEKLLEEAKKLAASVSATPGACGPYCSALSTNNPIPPPANTTCICNPLTTIKFTDVVDRILNILFFVALAVAPVMILVAGFRFLTGGEDPKNLTAARQMLVWTAVGFGVILLSKGIVLILRNVIGF